MSSVHAQNKAENRKILLKILQNVKLLGKQGIAFRWHENVQSNFIELIKLRDIDNPGAEWLDEKKN